MRIIKVIPSIILIIGIVLLPKMSMSNQDRICLSSEPGYSAYFGFSVAINERYLAVGDFNANRVSIYTRDNSDQWTKSRYISPPTNSVPHRVGRGFGRNLQLDDDILLIGASTRQSTKDVANLEEFQFVDESSATFVGQYLAKLSSEAEIQTLDFSIDTTPEFVKFTILLEGEVKQITLPDNGEEEFGYSTAHHQNLFLVGSPNKDTGGGAWLFELDKPEKKPLKLSLPNTYLGTKVAVSEEFIAVGFDGDYLDIDYDTNLLKKTLIRSINSGVISVIDEVGILSLSKNILAVMRPELPYDSKPPLLKVFRLDSDTTPNLIICREQKDLIDARVQNGFLVTVEGSYSSGINVCLESLDQ
ncbi:hypothetical protein IQ255_17665 [Pleurocapsales cyanobacterium LEGE 10410]|nr:hypothetical protein [Pleurocapsales cyanobacterium LEGE 10410]